MPLGPVRILRDALVITLLLLLNLGGNVGAGFFFFILLAMVVAGPSPAFKALAICYLGLMINQAFVPKSLVWTPSRIALPMIALLRFGIDVSQLRVTLLGRAWYITFMLFIFTMAVCSILSGWYTQIALLKLFNFWSCVSAILMGTAVLRHRRIDVSEWFVALIVSASVFGIASLVLGEGTNFMRFRDAQNVVSSDLFNGAFLHPNCHAMYASLFTVFLSCLFLLAPYRHRTLVLPMIGLWFVFMAFSQSRSSIISTLVPLLALVVYARPRLKRNAVTMRTNVKRSTLVVLGIAAVMAAVVVDLGTDRLLTRKLVTFFNKSNTSESLDFDVNKALQSRRALIEFSWNNFRDSPLHGIGFGVAKTEYFVKNATLFTAPSEKGFLPTAILEEGGILGAGAFLIFITTFFGVFVVERNVPAVVVCLAFLVSNLGEVAIFAPGGAGGFGWIMVGAASILGDHCWMPAARAGTTGGIRSASQGQLLGPSDA